MPISHVIGFDDAPFERPFRGDVSVVGAVFAGPRLEGVLTTRVRRDGANATERLATAVMGCRFAGHLQLVMLQGIALAGFNVVDIDALHERLQIPVLVVARRAPDLASIQKALLTRVPGGSRKWRLIERAGPMEPAEGVFIQRVGISLDESAEVLRHFALNSRIPEPLRTAHLIAGGFGTGESKGRV